MTPRNQQTTDWQFIASRLILLTLGALLGAFGVALFFVPSDIAPSGVTGVAVIMNELVGIPIGLTIIVANIPILILGYEMLSGWKSTLNTIYVIGLYSAAVEIMPRFVPNGVSNDLILNALFGGVVVGVGAGLIYRAGGTMGGTSTLARIIRRKFGITLSTSSLFTDTFVIVAAGIVFRWEIALYAAIALFVSRMASDYVLDGPSTSSTAIILTNEPAVVRDAITEELERSVASWQAEGGAKKGTHAILMVTISHAEVESLKKVIRDVEPDAFMTVLQAQVAYGEGFQPMYPHMPLKLDERGV